MWAECGLPSAVLVLPICMCTAPAPPFVHTSPLPPAFVQPHPAIAAASGLLCPLLWTSCFLGPQVSSTSFPISNGSKSPPSCGSWRKVFVLRGRPQNCRLRAGGSPTASSGLWLVLHLSTLRPGGQKALVHGQSWVLAEWGLGSRLPFLRPPQTML